MEAECFRFQLLLRCHAFEFVSDFFHQNASASSKKIISSTFLVVTDFDDHTVFSLSPILCICVLYLNFGENKQTNKSKSHLRISE